MISVKRILVAVGGGVIAALAMSSPATAATVSATPASWTPYLLSSPADQVVEELEPCNGTMYAVGAMTAVARGSSTYTRSNAFSFSETTGVMTSWAPQINGKVRSIAFSPDCSIAYLGGMFTSVNGLTANRIVAVSTSTGAVVTGFRHSANGQVNTVRYANGAVIIGGGFTSVNGVSRTRMASLNPSTGVVTSYLNLSITGTYPNASTKVYNSQLSHAGDRLLIEGVFTSIAGQPRQQAAVLDLGPTSVTLDGWTSSELANPCSISWYVRAGNWSPDDSQIYLATTGYKPPSGWPGSNASLPRAGLCDAVAAFPATSGAVSHTLINYTGCDSLYAVAADSSNIYIAGHERWANNANGCDVAGPGAVSRPGIGSIDPSTGFATSWNPTRSLGHGSHQLLLTSAGLWVASDTWTDGNAQMCGGVRKHGGICFLPY